MSETPLKNNQEITVRNDSANTISSLKIPEFIKNNPFLTLFNVGLIIGGILAYTFFAKIKYLPEFDLQNATTLLIGIALVGIAVTIGLGICLILPSLLIQSFLSPVYAPIENNELDKDALKEIKKQHASALFISSILAGIVVVTAWFLIASLSTHFEWYLLLLSTVILTALLLVQYCSYKKILSGFRREQVEKIYGNREKFIYPNALLLVAWILPSLILILIFLDPFKSLYQNQSWYSMGLLLLSLLVIIVNNSMLAASHVSHKPKGKLFFQGYFLITLSCLIVYANLPNNQTSLINLPFQILHLGNVSNSIFVVNAETCKMLNTLKPNACFENRGTNLGCVAPKRVASRIGKEYLLIFDGSTKNSKLNEITIPLKKEHALGWSFDNQAIPEACKNDITG